MGGDQNASLITPIARSHFTVATDIVAATTTVTTNHTLTLAAAITATIAVDNLVVAFILQLQVLHPASALSLPLLPAAATETMWTKANSKLSHQWQNWVRKLKNRNCT